jgi:hypothetical protein
VLGAATLAGALAAGGVLQAVATIARTLSSVNATRDPGLVPMVSTESFLLQVRWPRVRPDPSPL